MKGFLLAILAIIAAVLVLGGTVAYNMVSEVVDDGGSVDSSSINKLINKVSEVTSDGDNQDSGDDKSIIDDVSDIVSEEVKFNYQNGEGYYREVTYKDGGFRQYDSDSGELIGSSYDSDQDKLPSLE